MRGKDMDLPAGDREDTPEPVKVQREGEGLIATLDRLSKDPSIVPPSPLPTSATVRKTDAAMALTYTGHCPFCEALLNEDGQCQPCKASE